MLALRLGKSRVRGSPSRMYACKGLTKLGLTRKPPRLRSSIYTIVTIEADVQRSVTVGAAFAGPLHALRVGHGVPLQRQLPGRAAGELVEVESGFPLLAPLLLQVPLLLVRQLVVEGQADV